MLQRMLERVILREAARQIGDNYSGEQRREMLRILEAVKADAVYS